MKITGRLDPLPESEQEVRALRRLYGMSRSKVYIGAEAREDRVKSEAGRSKPTKTEALRRAALNLMRNPETRHPFYWAGFVLLGDGK